MVYEEKISIGTQVKRVSDNRYGRVSHYNHDFVQVDFWNPKQGEYVSHAVACKYEDLVEEKFDAVKEEHEPTPEAA